MGANATSEQSETFEHRYFETLRRAQAIGAVALRGFHFEELAGYERRQYDELESGFVEALNGTVNTHYEFELNEQGKLVARDKEPTEFMLNRALVNAQLLARQDSFFEFMVARNKAELDELHDQEAMARGRTDYNTIITFSPYNEELATSPVNVKKLEQAAQVPHWRRSMVRVSHWDGQRLHVFTRSIDNSSVGLLRETAAGSPLEYQFRVGSANAMLAERITKKLPTAFIKNLPVMITNEADKLLGERNRGLEFRQGRSEQEAKAAHEFIQTQSDIVLELINVGRRLALEHDNFTDYKNAFEDAVFNCSALLQARFERGIYEPLVDYQAAAEAAGAVAEAEGREYNMCGYILKRGEPNVGVKTGFESLLRLEGKKIQCPECKHQVVVLKSELAAGHLHCPDCGYGVDVCTGRRFSKKPDAPKSQQKNPGFVDQLTKALAEHSLAKSEAKT